MDRNGESRGDWGLLRLVRGSGPAAPPPGVTAPCLPASSAEHRPGLHPDGPTDWERIASCRDEWTALTLHSELEAEGFVAWLRPLTVSGYQALQPMFGLPWGEIFVARADADEARALIQPLLQGDGA